MAKLKEIYHLTVDLLDKRDGGGALDKSRLMNITAKFPLIATAVALELAEANNIYLENPILDSLEDDVELPNFSAYAVMPYAMAAEIARQGGASEMADSLLLHFQQMKRAIRLPEGTISDTENAMYGLTGRI